jgi:Ca2+/Na+ antiporter
MCILWMFALTYVLIVSLGIIADLVHVNGAIMGLTIGAMAGSYPALLSSIVVAREGHGNMAMGNAIGSNIFNNLLGEGSGLH